MHGETIKVDSNNHSQTLHNFMYPSKLDTL